MKSRSFFMKCGALVVAIGLAVAVVSVANAAEKNLGVPGYEQEKSNWCWAAAVKSIVKYKTGTTVSQCTIVKRGKNSTTCPNEGGTKANTRNALDRSGVNPGLETTLGWDEVVAEIKLSRPVQSGIKWRSGGGHAHVIRGYYSTGYSTGVSYIDPSTGTTTSREWSSYESNSSWKIGTGLIYLYKK